MAACMSASASATAASRGAAAGASRMHRAAPLPAGACGLRGGGRREGPRAGRRGRTRRPPTRARAVRSAAQRSAAQRSDALPSEAYVHGPSVAPRTVAACESQQGRAERRATRPPQETSTSPVRPEPSRHADARADNPLPQVREAPSAARACRCPAAWRGARGPRRWRVRGAAPRWPTTRAPSRCRAPSKTRCLARSSR